MRDTARYLWEMYDPDFPRGGLGEFQDILFDSYLALDGDVIESLDEEDPIYSHVFYARCNEFEEDLWEDNQVKKKLYTCPEGYPTPSYSVADTYSP